MSLLGDGMAEQSQNKTEHVMNVENNGPTLLTMIQLHQNFNFLYLIFLPGLDRDGGERCCGHRSG